MWFDIQYETQGVKRIQSCIKDIFFLINFFLCFYCYVFTWNRKKKLQTNRKIGIKLTFSDDNHTPAAIWKITLQPFHQIYLLNVEISFNISRPLITCVEEIRWANYNLQEKIKKIFNEKELIPENKVIIKISLSRIVMINYVLLCL